MNAKTVIPLVVAIALGGVAAKLGKDMMDKKRQTGGAGVKMARVIIANQDIAPGSIIKETDIIQGSLPGDAVPKHTFQTSAECLGRVAASQMIKGQPIFETLLAPRGVGGGAQAMIPEGMRAVTLEVNEFSGVAGLLVPGCRVDVVQTLRVKEDDSMMAKTIVENLKIVAVGRRMATVTPAPGSPEADQLARSVTILATQEQAEILDLAAHMGNPRLVLRNGADSKVTGGKGVTVAELRGVKDKADSELALQIAGRIFGAAPATRPAQPAVEITQPAPRHETSTIREVEVIRGGASTSVKFQVNNSASFTGGADRLDSAVPQAQ